uniref:Uncharacterized protein n=1 Tax=Vespula pensylvanica TaxID=30213 RepID=A0A834P5I8_VESPE|nr:hypothetical protein H0235_005750 [Vespula pensylvanica]
MYETHADITTQHPDSSTKQNKRFLSEDIRKGQLNRSAMEEPRPGGTAFLITVTSAPGKYAFSPLNTIFEYDYVTFCCGNIFDYAQHSG